VELVVVLAMEGLLDRKIDVDDGAGFRDYFKYTVIIRQGSVFVGSIPRDDYDWDIFVFFPDLLDESHAVHFRHLQVCNDEIKLNIAEHPVCFITISGDRRGVSFSFNDFFDESGDVFVVFSDEDVFLHEEAGPSMNAISILRYLDVECKRIKNFFFSTNNYIL
jgi:hypothetical protein